MSTTWTRFDEPMTPEERQRHIQNAGNRRRKRLQQLDQDLRDLEPHLLAAILEDGVSIVDVARWSAVSRPTLYALKSRGT